jgi:hypothetical protein
MRHLRVPNRCGLIRRDGKEKPAVQTTTFNFNPASSASDDSDSSTNRSLD